MRYRFACQDCGASVVVDEDVRESILANGCPLCGAPSGGANFEGVEANDPCGPT